MHIILKKDELNFLNPDGANSLFEMINQDLSKNHTDELIIDFKNIDICSTSFAGRFKEKMNEIKSKHADTRLKVVNVRRVLADILSK